MHTSKFTVNGIEYTIHHNGDWSGQITISWSGWGPLEGEKLETQVPGELVLAIGRMAATEQIISMLEARMNEAPKLVAVPKPDPVPMLLFCPFCHFRHIDRGEFAQKSHHTHACQGPGCGMVWRPAIVPTVGVEYLPGFKNDP